MAPEPDDDTTPTIEIVDDQPYGHDACPTIMFDPAADEHWCWKVHLHVPTGGGPSTLADAVAVLRARLAAGSGVPEPERPPTAAQVQIGDQVEGLAGPVIAIRRSYGIFAATYDDYDFDQVRVAYKDGVFVQWAEFKGSDPLRLVSGEPGEET